MNKKLSNESTTAAAIATTPGGGRRKPKRGASIYRDDPAGNLFRGISVRGGHQIAEEELSEDDLILMPGRRPARRTGFVPREMDRTDHEVAMARSDLLAAFKSAKTIFELLKDRSEEQGIEGWVQEKLIKANDYLNAVREYYEEQAVQSDLDGKYGMSSTCDCGPQCDCNPDFGSMFESVMNEDSKFQLPSAITNMFSGPSTDSPVDVYVFGPFGDMGGKITAKQAWTLIYKTLPKEYTLDSAMNFIGNIVSRKGEGIVTRKPRGEAIKLASYFTKNGLPAAIDGDMKNRPSSKFVESADKRTECPECGGPAYSSRMLAEKQDACYHKVKSRYKVWPSAYASGALVKCRKVGAKNWGKGGKK